MACFRTWFKSLENHTGKFPGQFNYYWKKGKKKPKRMASDFSRLSGFAAMEISNQLKQLFKIIDANEDGKRSPLQLTEILLNLGQQVKAAEELAQGMVKEMDCDGYGYVDLDEFISVMGMEIGNSSKDNIDEAFLVFEAYIS